jgi:flagellar FliJ protein
MFRFRLQTVLGFRKRQEEEKQRELAVVNMEHKGLNDKLTALFQDRENKSNELSELSLQPTDAKILKLYVDFLSGCESDIEWKKREIQVSAEKVRKKQLELQEYVKRKRVLEVLRERRLTAHVKEENRRERVQLDETATNMWFREAR